MTTDKKKVSGRPEWTITICWAILIIGLVMNSLLQKPWNSIAYHVALLLGVTYLLIINKIWPRKIKEKSIVWVWIGLGVTTIFLLMTGIDAYLTMLPFKYWVIGLGGVTSLEIFVYYKQFV